MRVTSALANTRTAATLGETTTSANGKVPGPSPPSSHQARRTQCTRDWLRDGRRDEAALGRPDATNDHSTAGNEDVLLPVNARNHKRPLVGGTRPPPPPTPPRPHPPPHSAHHTTAVCGNNNNNLVRIVTAIVENAQSVCRVVVAAAHGSVAVAARPTTNEKVREQTRTQLSSTTSATQHRSALQQRVRQKPSQPSCLRASGVAHETKRACTRLALTIKWERSVKTSF